LSLSFITTTLEFMAANGQNQLFPETGKAPSMRGR
jgi:hypothetical protein